ncbi:MAG: SET domain-containing methyltransferase [Patescibacteria group bacterium]
MKVVVFDNYIVGKNHLGKAVFAARNYKKDGVILMFKGPVVSKKDVPKDLFKHKDRFVQIGPNKFLGPSNTTDDYINHSCDPNAGLAFYDFGILLVALRPIKKGEEITWDYSTTLHKNPWTMNCMCYSKHCRKIVREFKFLPIAVKNRYLKLRILPPYIVKSMKNSVHNVSKKQVYNKRA